MKLMVAGNNNDGHEPGPAPVPPPPGSPWDRANVRTFRRLVPQGVLAVVKADAFGHGAVPVARAAVEAGVTWLGVARADEALRLRAAGLTDPILTWLYDAAELILLGDFDVDVSVSTIAERSRRPPYWIRRCW
jgi:alanine racemase